MSKAHFVHWRYIAIHMQAEAAPSRRALQRTLTAMGRAHGLPDDRLPNLTRYDWPHAIVRVQHMDAWPARHWLAALDHARDGALRVPLHVETLRSSGTIKTLTDRLGILTKR